MSYYLKENRVRARVHELGKRIGKDGVAYLDMLIDDAIGAAVKIHNGGRRTIDATVLRHVCKAGGGK